MHQLRDAVSGTDVLHMTGIQPPTIRSKPRVCDIFLLTVAMAASRESFSVEPIPSPMVAPDVADSTCVTMESAIRYTVRIRRKPSHSISSSFQPALGMHDAEGDDSARRPNVLGQQVLDSRRHLAL